MARINSKTLFLTTSPRSPEKMFPEIQLLSEHFSGSKWDSDTQMQFMTMLKNQDFFHGDASKNPELSARDRINRGPKSLGFVTLSPVVSLTGAGRALISSPRKNEFFLRQLLKFQLPSPYHIPSKDSAQFCVKPYLEFLRLIRHLGTLKFDELHLFGMQLTDWHLFDDVIKKINNFRNAVASDHGNYRTFKTKVLFRELRKLYSTDIAKGNFRVRESKNSSIEKFLSTKGANMRDYADAAFRYLRATGLVNVSSSGKSLSIAPERIADVDHILNTVDREPCHIDNLNEYTNYLSDISIPILLSDNKEALMHRIHTEFSGCTLSDNMSVSELKDILANLIEKKKNQIIDNQIAQIKSYSVFDDIQNTYDHILSGNVYDAPLIMEWNTWRAMTMLDGGNVKANLNFDDAGLPLSTAQGNMADIICDYGDFILIVEVTLSSGQRQYIMEGEPVSRHLGNIKHLSGKPCYCLFVAPAINSACIAHFYTLQNLNVSFYGGKSTIVPLKLSVFRKMLVDSYSASYTPNPAMVRELFEYSAATASRCPDENEWFEKINSAAMNWLHQIP